MVKRLSDREFLAYLERLERGEALPADLPDEDAADLRLAGRLLAQQVPPGPRLVSAVQKAMTATSSAAPMSLTARMKTKMRRLPMSAPKVVLWKRLAWGVAGLILAFALVMLAFPSARAAVLEAILKIGGITFVETEGIETGGEETWSEQVMSLAEAQATLPFTFQVPTWAPEGYVLDDDNVAVAHPFPEVTSVRMKWENAATGSAIRLWIVYATVENWEMRSQVGSDAVEKVNVSGQEAALVQGGWDYETGQYTTEGLQTLEWKVGQVYYALSGLQSRVTVDELVSMAESMTR